MRDEVDERNGGAAKRDDDVVRCRDCVYSETFIGKMLWCTKWSGVNEAGANGYCHYGERGFDHGKLHCEPTCADGAEE